MVLAVAAVPLQREAPRPPRAAVRTPQTEVKRVLAGMAQTRLAFQPIADLVDRRVVGFEALARFGSGLRTPTPYLQAAKAAGRSAELEAHLVKQALAARDTLPVGCFLAINVAPDLLSHPAVAGLLRDAGSLDDVVLELTEHVPVDDMAALRRRVDVLRSRGALLALDDTGAGWSGLRQVAELRPDIVKLDKSLVSDLDVDAVKQGLVELVVHFVSRLGGRLLVEGVERHGELDAAARLGVPLAQGWLLGRPSVRWSALPVEVAEALSTRTSHGDRAPRVGNSIDRTAPCVGQLAAIGFLPGEPMEVVVADGDGRPVGLWVRNVEEQTPSGWTHPVMTARVDEQAHDVVARAMTRPHRTRFDPVVCIDSDGRYAGLLHVEHLVTATVTAG